MYLINTADLQLNVFCVRCNGAIKQFPSLPASTCSNLGHSGSGFHHLPLQ